MIRLRHLATLLLVTAFAVIQLLATAPLLHPNCNPLGTLALQGPAAPAVHTPEGTAASRSTDEKSARSVTGSGRSQLLTTAPRCTALALNRSFRRLRERTVSLMRKSSSRFRSQSYTRRNN